MADFRNLKSVRDISQANPAFTEPSLRWLIFNSKSNGLDEALVRVNRRVYIDTERFNEWLEQGRASSAD